MYIILYYDLLQYYTIKLAVKMICFYLNKEIYKKYISNRFSSFFDDVLSLNPFLFTLMCL